MAVFVITKTAALVPESGTNAMAVFVIRGVCKCYGSFCRLGLGL